MRDLFFPQYGVLAAMARGEYISEADLRRVHEAQSIYSAAQTFAPAFLSI